MRRSELVRYVLEVASLVAVYFGAGKLGLALAFVPGVSLVWPPSGIALAALLLFGYRMWPGIALGAFLVNHLTVAPLAAAASVAAGNTLEALIGAFLLRRVIGFHNSMERLRDVLGLVVCAAVASTA